MEQSTIALIIIGIAMILYVTETFPIATTSFLVVLALGAFRIIPMNTAFAGFGSDTTFLIVGMVVVGAALFETGVANVMGENVMKLMAHVGENERIFALILAPVTVLISLVLSNTATTGIMLPIAGSTVAASAGKLLKKNTFMMIGIITVASGGITIVGSTPQQIAQQFLLEGGYEPIRFWELSRTGLPMVLLAVVFFQTIGMKLQKKVFDFPEVENDNLSPPAVKDGRKVQYVQRNSTKMVINIVILAFCVAGFITSQYDFAFWSLGGIAMMGAVACIATGCISQKRVFEKMDWTTVVIMGCSIGISAGIRESGAGELIADTVLSILGGHMTPWLLVAALALVTMVLTNFMSSTATTALMVPIAATLAHTLGYDVRGFVMLIAVAGNLGFATPVSTPPIAMTLSGGYRFKDYVIIGGLFNVLAYLLLVAIFPLVFTIR